MMSFLWLAAVMVVIACLLVVLPLMRKGDHTSPVSLAVARTAMVAVIVVLPLGALNLYKAFSNWNWETPVAAVGGEAPQSIPEMVARLEQRLSQQGGDSDDWYMLARSYLVMERVDDSIAAFERVMELSNGGTADMKLDFADALLAGDPGSVSGRAGALIEAALQQAPSSRKALWYGGSVAYQKGNFAAAIERWETLLKGNPPPPDAMRNVLVENIGAAQSALGLEPEAPPAMAEESATDGAAVSVSVTLDPALAGDVAPGTPLFIIARAAGQQGGPPVAVQRRSASELPLTVTLSDRDAMLPTRKLSGFDSVEIVARLSLSGGPVAGAGDLYGTVNYNKGAASSVSVLIDKVYP
ncbi:MAG: hypothetical protein AAFN78_13405 [Pseudomonadota bacterium]